MIRQALSQHEADTATAMGEVATMKREYELRFRTLEKDVSILDEKSKMLVTSYELEQRLQTSLIRFDELRRRIVAMEDQVFGFNLDGALIAPQLVVRRDT
jgi:primosomal protein N''